MPDVVVQVDRLSKRFRRYPPHAVAESLGELLARGAAKLGRAAVATILRRRSGGSPSEFWALREVSFSVRSGEIVGIIGSNGAGKSTLLRILSQITPPTSGRAEIRGRVGSLLEVGTGFHPDLSGRENILLNGAILGMRRAEIQQNFDAIVAFAGIEGFLDTPVKRYSTGMYLRLAFAVAAHLQTEILLVDEVLAVGDAMFQKKCLGKMTEVASGGRTVLFVSHNLTAVQQLCSRAVWLRAGRVERIGDTADVVSAYLRESTPHEGPREWPEPALAPGNDWIRLHRAEARRPDDPSATLLVDTPFAIEIEYWNFRAASGLALSIHVFNELGVLVFCAGLPHEEVFGGQPLPEGLLRDRCEVPGGLLNDGTHRIELYVMQGQDVIFHEPDLLSFTVHDSGRGRGAWFGKWPGAVRPHLAWTTELLNATAPPNR